MEMNLDKARFILEMKKYCMATGDCSECRYRIKCDEIGISTSTIEALEWLIKTAEKSIENTNND